MKNLLCGCLAAALVSGACAVAAFPASAAVIGVHIGDVSVSNGHYYDRQHHRQAYSYPSDWKSYHHGQSWYHSHPSWNDSSHHDYYRN